MTNIPKITFDLDKVTIEEAIMIEEMADKDAEGNPVHKDFRFRDMMAIFDRACTVTGPVNSVYKLPLTAIPVIMNGFVAEMQAMSGPENPTQASDGTS